MRFNRRQFLIAAGAAATPMAFAKKNALEEHIVERVETGKANYRWPRFVGKNARKDFHGQDKRAGYCRIITTQGAVGWAESLPWIAEKFKDRIIGKKVSELIAPGVGCSPGVSEHYDLALHDLMGVILNKPVYQLLGAMGTKETSIYSGMIYFDELNEGGSLEQLLANCEWDFDYGYRALKVKIGRSGKWYSHTEGLAMDIKVVRSIHEQFKGRDVTILVDSNDQYSPDDAKAFLKGIDGIPLYWFEEPFRETVADGRAFRKWMNENGFKDTRYADGEYDADDDVLLELGRSGDLDVYLPDIRGYGGLTRWVNVMPKLAGMGVKASPHTWGSKLKTHYVAHLAAGVGNVDIIEGVTCLSDDIDFGDYPIENGKIRVSDAPGFGMKLLT